MTEAVTLYPSFPAGSLSKLVHEPYLGAIAGSMSFVALQCELFLVLSCVAVQYGLFLAVSFCSTVSGSVICYCASGAVSGCVICYCASGAVSGSVICYCRFWQCHLLLCNVSCLAA